MRVDGAGRVGTLRHGSTSNRRLYMPLAHVFLFALATLAVGSAAIFIVLSGVDPAGIAVWRLGVTALVFMPVARGRVFKDLAALSRGERWALFGGGVTFGLHFVLFNTAFDHTTYESVVVLLAAQPLFAALLGFAMLRERVTTGMIASVLISGAGLAVLVWQDYTFNPAHLVGDAIVVVGSLMIVFTYTWGRSLRPRMAFASYVVTLYTVGAIVAALALLFSGQSLLVREAEIDPTTGWTALLILIGFCTIVGHTLFNYVVKFVPVFYINLVILFEPIIAIVLKVALRDEFAVFADATLKDYHIVGGVILAVGVLIGFLVRDRRGAGRRGRKDAADQPPSGVPEPLVEDPERP